MQRTISTTVAALVLACPSLSDAAPPTEAEIKEKTEAAMAYYRAQGSDFSLDDPGFHAVIDAQLNGVDLAECDMEVIASMQMLWAYSPNAKPVWMARIEELGTGPEWLDACLMLSDLGDNEKALALAMPHGFIEVPDERIGEVLQALGSLSEEQLVPMQGELVLLADRMPDGDAEAFMTGWSSYPELLGKAKVETETRRAIHGRLVDAMKRGLTRSEELAKTSSEPEAKRHQTNVRKMSGTIRLLDGPAGRGELIGYPAPTVEMLWNSEGADWKSFDSLKGKVLVLDFWATWCGPCVGSFPQVRELVEYYDGYDVVVLGLTSEQGNVIFRDDRGRTAAKDFADECRMMEEYAEAMDVTWPVVFTEQDVFNADFGIRGIPHVAIIAPDGKVAYNNLHPASPLEGKVEKINGLLEKAGMKHPPSVAERKATEKG